MNRDEARVLAWQLMTEHGLPDDGWQFRFDSARRRFGSCQHGAKLITLSGAMTDSNNVEQVRDTILHEIAHALVGHGAGHGEEWKRVALRLGARPTAYYSSATVDPVAPTFRGRCPACGRERMAFRRGNIACGKCCKAHNGGRYDARFKLVWRRCRSDLIAAKEKENA